jgi:hypothetical protein
VIAWIAIALWAVVLVVNVALEIATRRRRRRLEAMRREVEDPDYVRAQAAAICRSFVVQLRTLVEKEPPSPTRDRALAVVAHFERAISRDGRGLS